MKTIYSIILSGFLLVSLAGLAQGQSVDAYVGLGTAMANPANLSSDTFGDGNIYGGSRLGGLFGTVGADVLITRHFGIGAESSFRLAQGAYAGLNYRPVFYDFNGIWTPASHSHHVVPEIQAGLGGVNLNYYYPSTYCDQFVGCSTSNQYVESSHHFQAHFGVGVRLYTIGGLYIRPQVDVHWVNDFYQFGQNWVPEYGAVIGYSFGHSK